MMADFDINSILQSLSPEDMESIKSLASEFLGSSSESKPTEEKLKPPTDLPDLSKLSGIGMPDLSQLSAILPILQTFNKPDNRVEFINALKPLLSEARRRKADEAMNLLRLMSVIPMLRERGML